MYSEQVIEHFHHPHNQGKIENADGIGKVGNPKCGDVMYMYIKVKDNVIEDIKFETFGCAAAIATSSVMTDLVKGKTIDEALKVTKNDVIQALGELPSIKIHCSLLAEDGIKAAIKNYQEKQKAKG
ncbi:Fe-S cluster assembly scaffold protein NifU [Candidatus Margulisiibacteriota bacterium]